jgi:hypothetical protein
MILKSKGYSVYVKFTAEFAIGKLKVPRGSVGKILFCGT